MGNRPFEREAGRHDIRTTDDIAILVRSFYERVRPDPELGHFFADLDWGHHIPRIASFWAMVLLGDRSYQGDPMTTHIRLARTHPMEPRHFERWLAHWQAAVDDLFSGPKSDEAKERARTIAGIMAHKVGRAAT